MASSLPLVVTGAPNLRIEESRDDCEYYGPMTFIRVDGVGEHQEDPEGLYLQLCGRYNPEMLERVALALNGRRR